MFPLASLAPWLAVLGLAAAVAGVVVAGTLFASVRARLRETRAGFMRGTRPPPRVPSQWDSLRLHAAMSHSVMGLLLGVSIFLVGIWVLAQIGRLAG